MKRVFIPNRGEIAVRIVAACRALGLGCVVGAAAPDLDGMAAGEADDVVCLAPGPPAAGYLREDVVVQAALDTYCDAIHPGYGFLSERPRLAACAREQGLVFVGPPTATLELAADPPAARAAAERAGVRVLGAEEVDPARDVAVHFAADEHGVTLHLGDCDGSVQRRGETVVEETPAPALPSATRTTVTDGAVAVARATGYRNLGAAVFVIDARGGEAYFRELTCRIPVAHPVTEAVTGIDLVAMQLRIAAGEPIGVSQDEIVAAGHAVECRLKAEDLVRGYAPSPGMLSVFAIPDRPGLRVDTHCRAGTVVPPGYDPLLAKLTGHGDTRERAIEILLGALEDIDVGGVQTNRALLIGALAHPHFRAGAVTTAWLGHTMG